MGQANNNRLPSVTYLIIKRQIENLTSDHPANSKKKLTKKKRVMIRVGFEPTPHECDQDLNLAP